MRSILQMREVKHREVKKLVCSHTAHKWQSQDLNCTV